MGNSKLVYSFFFLFFISFSSFGSIHKCPDKQRDALLVFKQNISSYSSLYYESYVDYETYSYCRALHGSRWYDLVHLKMDWNTSIDCCDWNGITCNNFTGDVITLNLGCGPLKGVSELDILLSSLPKLEAIDLSYSGLSVVTKNNVEYVNPGFNELRLAYCKLTKFPDFLHDMKHLRLLDLSGNHISGHIPSWAGEIGGNNLIYLDLSYNFIAGLTEFRSDGLQYLYLQSNLIQGPFPPWICSKKHLKYLDISNNTGITGMVPQCLLNISSSLVSLNVKSNMIQGPFPSWICDLGHLLYLDMSNNSFDGVIPRCFGNMISSLAMIDLSANQFSGTIPKVNGFCDLLDVFILNGNKLEGDVPCFLAKCQSLRILDLGNNQLNGIFPPWLGDLPKLQVLSLHSNNFHGSVGAFSISVFPFSSLRVFDISSNGFVGRLPEKYFESFNAIKDVDKSQKTEIVNLSGLHSYSISVLVNGFQLSYSTSIYIRFTLIDLSSNRFEGDIPYVIGNLRSLKVLNLSNNNLSGQIPHVLRNLMNIEALDLSRNQLVGEIPQSLTDLREIAIFNVSQNHLVGHIPERGQFLTFYEDSFYGNPGLCGIQLYKKCEHLSSPKTEAKRGEHWSYMKPLMLGMGCGTLLGVVWGYRMLSTGKPKWLTAIANAGGHIRRRKRKHVHIRRRK